MKMTGAVLAILVSAGNALAAGDDAIKERRELMKPTGKRRSRLCP